jgi:hypothetical protein
MLLFIINKESNKILEIKENYCIRPIRFYMTIKDMPIGTSIYY